MSQRRYLYAVFLTALFVLPASGGLDLTTAKPPIAQQIKKTLTLHGETISDNYFWLRDKKKPEVIAYLEAENAYTAAVMKPTARLQETLYNEMLGRIKQTDLSVPTRIGEYEYYTRTEEGKQYPIRCRKGAADGKEQVLLDLNEMAKGKKFLALGAFTVSDDGNLLAFSTDVTGYREYMLQIKDLRTGKLLPDSIKKVGNVVWTADNKSLCYGTEDDAKRPYRIYRHMLEGKDDTLIYEEKDELYRVFVRRSHDKAFLFLQSISSTTSETRYLKADKPDGKPTVVLPREEGHRYTVDHRDGLFYLTTNKDAKNFRLVTAPVDDPKPAKWKEIVPHRKDVLLQGVLLFENFAVLMEQTNALPRLTIRDFRTQRESVVDFPDPLYSVFPMENPEFKTKILRFSYQSLVTPSSVYDYDMDKKERKLLKRTEVPGYDPSRYTSERIHVKTKDGARVPVSLVYKKTTPVDGTSPLLLYGYGSYGSSASVSFSASRVSLLDRGMIYAIAHIRGGRELGEEWYENGKMLNKRNTFTDFVAVADNLVERKYTSHEKLVIEGGSAGGLLIGAVLNLKPDVCRVAVLHVPFVDVINSMLDESLPLTVQEFLEWGNPKVKKEYEYMKTYCPYTNLAAKAYPSMLVRTSLNDSQVGYWESAKYVARLRTLKTDKNPLLLKVNMAAGHGGHSGRFDAKETAFTYAFVLTELGLEGK